MTDRPPSLPNVARELLKIAVRAMSTLLTLVVVVVYLALRRWFRFLP